MLTSYLYQKFRLPYGDASVVSASIALQKTIDQRQAEPSKVKKWCSDISDTLRRAGGQRALFIEQIKWMDRVVGNCRDTSTGVFSYEKYTAEMEKMIHSLGRDQEKYQQRIAQSKAKGESTQKYEDKLVSTKRDLLRAESGEPLVFFYEEYNQKVLAEIDILNNQLAELKSSNQSAAEAESESSSIKETIRKKQTTEFFPNFSIITISYKTTEGKTRYHFIALTDFISGEQGSMGIVQLGFPIEISGSGSEKNYTLCFDKPLAIKIMINPIDQTKSPEVNQDKQYRASQKIIDNWKKANKKLDFKYSGILIRVISIPEPPTPQSAAASRSRSDTGASRNSTNLSTAMEMGPLKPVDKNRQVLESYVVLPWRDGKTLADIIDDDVYLAKDRSIPSNKRVQRPLHERMSYQSMLKLCIAIITAVIEFQESNSSEKSLAAKASSFVHRDIKPENIMCYQDDNLEWRVELLDYDMRVEAKKAIYDDLAGTPAYMAPERLRHRQQKEKSTIKNPEYIPLISHDTYSLGIVLAIVLSGSYRIVLERDKQFMLARSQAQSHLSASQVSAAENPSIQSSQHKTFATYVAGPLAALDMECLNPENVDLKRRYPGCNLAPICDIISQMLHDPVPPQLPERPSLKNVLLVFQAVQQGFAGTTSQERDMLEPITEEAAKSLKERITPAVVKAQFSIALIDAIAEAHKCNCAHLGLNPLNIQYKKNLPGSGLPAFEIILPDYDKTAMLNSSSQKINVELHDLDPHIIFSLKKSNSYTISAMHDIYNVGLLLLLLWLESDIAVLARAEQLGTSYAEHSAEKRSRYIERDLNQKLSFIKGITELAPLDLSWIQNTPKANQFWKKRYPELVNQNIGDAIVIHPIRSVILAMLRIDDKGKQANELQKPLSSAKKVFQDFLLTQAQAMPVIIPSDNRRRTLLPLSTLGIPALSIGAA